MNNKIYLISLLVFLFIFPSIRPLKAKPGKFQPGAVDNSPTVRFNINFSLPGNKKQFYFLLKNLPLTCTIIRILDLENLQAQKVEHNYFRARDHAGLEGFIYYHSLSPGFLKATGAGTHASSSLPFNLRGRVSTKIQWKNSEPKVSTVGATINIQASNSLLHYTGQILAPIINRVARSKIQNLKEVARKFLIDIKNNKKKIKSLLDKTNKEKNEKWSDYPAF